ncbi:alkylation response protein AidB-like acyl-CoA dehydrogenase [Marinobacterium halophilum]|uniref:Alkylation response protein AidB-like acyl-CoA dehydrogenase n=1 Tax=Marinobacterium halophilum TaxID=267374 RepID=A0A2P8EN17_9GAMM|nr:acyl-CoA dehydrogenase family protein [Marinobacterium halophilum]PSL10842.1 alkylation response protein AidB-like acyl-CoA dehydrogenase [Marinobacterium halophilum]
MDFTLTEDQRAISDMAQGLFEDFCTDERMREFDQSGETIMQDLWQTCVQTGLHSLYIPEDFGGSGLGMTELMLVLEAQGRGLGMVPLWRHQVAATALATFAGDHFSTLVQAAATADTVLTLGLSESVKVTGLGLAAVPEGSGWRVDGTAYAVPCALEASLALVLVNTEEGVRPACINLDSENVQVRGGVSTHGESVADLVCEGLSLPADALLPLDAVEWLESRAIACMASLQMGVSAEQIRRTAEYVSERVQFDRKIAQFQAVQMTMADCQIATEALRTCLWQLCYRIDHGMPAAAEALSTAWHAVEAGHFVGHKAQHVHGGIGVDLTYPIHRFLYWSRALSVGLGGNRATLERLGDWLATHDTLGWKYDLDENKAV